MQVHERLKRILKELEDINKDLKSKAIENAIESLKIALHGEKVGSEGFEHSYIRRKLMETFGGNIYVESGGTKISKLGFRPDLVIIREGEVIIAEIETDARRALKKMDVVAKKLEIAKRYPVFANRKLRVIFALSKEDERAESKAKELGFELFVLEGEELVKVI